MILSNPILICGILVVGCIGFRIFKTIHESAPFEWNTKGNKLIASIEQDQWMECVYTIESVGSSIYLSVISQDLVTKHISARDYIKCDSIQDAKNKAIEHFNYRFN